ncbi:PRPP-binding protein, adenine/guanine phosphoribosyltransferase [Spongiibacter sp. IMCC21906]|jgi:xanthine phosphoribosyltransferase|uniref:xanthine phosphoribosyltransferase n=1 Tax=Spongiibacter sp. IMCC21906 TaxID=1620392 RepID=UPI00062E047D|nr:xanthine phosphoribosyltransferase [Spongiibacter sp. IMCC21906]AKH70173.1 PRPP-binding protein, adenine/guanine phosphoribosyltransferase [Spongiibacter sp. IMCC21906]
MLDTPPIYYLSWDEFHRDTRSLAKQLASTPWKGIICIARGGLVPGAILARELNLRLVDTLCIASYDHDKQGEISILKSIESDGEGYLLVDDLVDSGKTAEIAKQMLPKACFVTVYAKPKAKALADIYVKEFSQDTWIHFPWDIQYSYSAPLVGG